MLSFNKKNLCLDVDGWTHLFIGSISKFSTEYLYLIIRQANQFAAFIFHTKEYNSPFGVSEGYHFFSYLLLRSKCFFKLHFGGLTTKAQVFKSIFSHTIIIKNNFIVKVHLIVLTNLAFEHVMFIDSLAMVCHGALLALKHLQDQ